MDIQKLKSIAKRMKSRNGLTKFTNDIIYKEDELFKHSIPEQRWIEKAMLDNAIMNATLNNNYLIEDLVEVSYGNLKRYIKDNFYDDFNLELISNGAINVMANYLESDAICYIECTLQTEKSLSDEEVDELSRKAKEYAKEIASDAFSDDKFIKKYVLDNKLIEYAMASIKEMMKITGQQFQCCRYLIFNYFDPDTRYYIGIDKDICEKYTEGRMLFVDAFKKQIYDDYSSAFDILQEKIIKKLS